MTRELNQQSIKTKENTSPDITISKNNDIIKLEISDYMAPFAFLERLKAKDNYNLYNMLGNEVIWNSKYQCINKGNIYAFNHNGIIYNILIDKENVVIDERYRRYGVKEERILRFNEKNGSYSFFNCKFDDIGSSYELKNYSSDDNNLSFFEISKDDFTTEFNLIMTNLETVPEIRNIINVDLIKQSISNHLDTNPSAKNI